MTEEIEIPLGAFDSETIGWTYTIPEGFTAKIEDGKIIVEKQENDDEKIRKELIDFIQWAEDRGRTRHDYHQAKRPAVWIAYLEKQKEQKPAVEQPRGLFTPYDMAKTFVEGQHYVVEHPEKFGLCKPAEWSEEDEQWLESIIKDYEDSLIKDKDHAAVIKIKIDFLKSLRPKPHWKPSEEQIAALERAIIKTHTVDDIGILAELRDNLKKL